MAMCLRPSVFARTSGVVGDNDNDTDTDETSGTPDRGRYPKQHQGTLHDELPSLR